MTITSRTLRKAHFPANEYVTANEDALDRCDAALKFKDRGDHESALKVMRPLWKGPGERPEIESLHPSVSAEVQLCVGILTCWLGYKHRLPRAQESAKNVLTESITYFESAGDTKKVAAARAELAYCYWWKGELNEARIMFVEALEKLTAEGITRARALLGLAVVEWTASRYDEALKILTESSSLFRKLNNHAIKAAYHNQLALLFRSLGDDEKRKDYIQQAILEYQQADLQSKFAHNTRFRADIKNNVGFLLFKLSRLKEAHNYLDEARGLATRTRNSVLAAQIDETRAQVFVAQKRFKQAEAVARLAVRSLERSGHQCLLTDALITHGIALARLKRADSAQFTFQRAIEVGRQVGALNKAGMAALTMIEEVEELAPDTLFAAFENASEWLAKPQSQDLLLRLNAAARKVCLKLYAAAKGEGATTEDTIEALLNKPCVLQTEVLKFESQVIRQALAKANGSVTRAAALLSMSYQALAYVLDSRHRELLKDRSPIRRRSRKETAT